MLAAFLALNLQGASAQAAEKHPVIAVVLSGGGALGLAHLGVLKVIDALGVPVDIVVGTSMGAIVGGLYAVGYTPAQMADFAERADWDELFSDAPMRSPQSFHEKMVGERHQLRLGFDRRGLWTGQGLVAGQNVTTLFELLTLDQAGIDDFDKLPRRYRAIAMDILTGEEVVLESGSLADAMRASMSLPAIFSPYPVGGRYLVDGGIIDSLPVAVAKKMGADVVIAVRVRTPPVSSIDELTSPIAVLSQTSRLVVQRNVETQARLADLLIEPDLSGLKAFEFNRAEEFVARGEAAARECLSQLMAIAAVADAPASAETNRVSAPTGADFPETAWEGSLRSSFRISAVTVEGAVGDDAQVIASSFRPLIGAPVDGSTLRAAVDRAYESGRFDYVRIRFGALADGGRKLIVGVAPAVTTRSALLFGIDYEGSWSTAVRNSFDLSAGITVQGLTGKGSQLLAEGMFVDTQYLYLEYYQPVGGYLFIDPYFKVLRYFELRSTAGGQIGFPMNTLGGGLWAGVPIGYGAQVQAGYAIASVLTYSQNLASAISLVVSAARAALEVDNRPTAVFPHHGLAAEVGYETAVPALGGNARFQKLAADFQANLPVGEALTLGLTFSGGTDFTTSPSDPGVLRLYDSFDLRSRQQFVGYRQWEVVGSHKAAAGFDARFRVFPLSQVFASEIFLLANFSLGNCWQDPLPPPSDLTLRCGGSFGIGARMQRSLGLRMLVSVIDSGRFQLSLDLGSMTEHLFDRE